MDFGIFGFSPEQVQEFRTFLATQQQLAQGQAGGNNQQQQQSSATDGTTGAAGGATTPGNEQQGTGAGAGDRNSQGEPVLMHNAQHCGVVCDICNTEIRGFRYKCMQCPDYDLCAKCEHKGHHAGHVMMRISFPEQARDAIRKYLQNGGVSCPPSPEAHARGPHHGPHPHHRGPHHHGPHHGPGPHVAFEEVFRRGHCHRRGSGLGDDSDRPATAPGCPYTMGKKEFKKWSKWMKRAATHQHRSAEAYARAAAAGGTGAAADASAEGADGAPDAMDFAAVASQIQEFLNYWGIPVDVVELYDQFGNRGQPTNSTEQQSRAAGAGTAGQNANATDAAATNAGTQENTESTQAAGTQNQQPGSPVAANLAENMQQMHINETQNNPSAPRDDSLLMDLDNDNSGWTILDNSQSREQTPGNSNTETQQPAATSPTPQAQTGQNENQTRASPAGSMNSNNGNTSTPFASAGSSNTSSGQSQPTSVPSAPAFPAGVPNVPLYPVLNTPQIQQILQGVSSAVNNVVRSIPIVTDPRGPMGTNVTNSTGGQIPATGPTGQAGANPELDARSMKTLNQLLAMGFSNEGGYLTRLVLAKNGDLEAVLSSLFPN